MLRTSSFSWSSCGAASSEESPPSFWSSTATTFTLDALTLVIASVARSPSISPSSGASPSPSPSDALVLTFFLRLFLPVVASPSDAPSPRTITARADVDASAPRRALSPPPVVASARFAGRFARRALGLASDAPAIASTSARSPLARPSLARAPSDNASSSSLDERSRRRR